ncbi:MAG: SDR family NAD(P)-dependent oxidoreductase, partial [Alphaproteobacteria bacterium]
MTTSILITGGSSGLGAALALEYAAPGVFIALNGRSAARLDDIAKQCEQRGAITTTSLADVTDKAAMRDWMETVDAAQPLDLIIANAGVSGQTAFEGRDIPTEAQTRAIFDINVNGVLNTVGPAMDLMRPRKQGQIGIVSSLAGFRGLPSAPAYCASKAAVRSYGEGLRGVLGDDGIGVSVICPGYVKSRITDANDFPMPLFMQADRAARKIRHGLDR